MMKNASYISGILPRRTCVWIDDDSVDECYHCHVQFNWYTRRHHCRGCGRVFCYQCSKYCIYSSQIDKTGIIHPAKYLKDCLENTYTTSYRSCIECTIIFKKIKQLSSLITILETLSLEITEYNNLRQLNKMWYEACNIVYSKFREIQFNLPNHIFNNFEKKILKSNLHLIVGHNKLMCQFIKSVNWGENSLDHSDHEYYMRLIKTTEKPCPCSVLMCSRNCQINLTDSEVIDILLHIDFPPIRSLLIENYLATDPQIFECYVPILTQSIQMERKYGEKIMRDHLIKMSLIHRNIRYKFFWELMVKLEDPNENSLYRETYDILLEEIKINLGKNELSILTNGMKFVDVLSNININQFENLPDSLKESMISCKLDKKQIPVPTNPNMMLRSICYKDAKIMTSATKPLFISCFVKGKRDKYSFIYKSEDVRKDQIISDTIKIMDHMLKLSGMDMHIVTYNVVPTSPSSGMIEIVPNSETLYNIKEKKNYSIQNYILENNSNLSVKEVRNRFVKSTAAYCVITYLLGIGDRHLDNIMVTNDGKLFHIDFSFVMGHDPKPLAPKLRITPEMIDAIGGANSRYYHQFEEYCDQIYNELRRHSCLFTNMLSLLTLNSNQFTKAHLETEIGKRFLPGEFRSQAKIQLIKAINTSKDASTTISDMIHYHCKETLNWKNWTIYNKASSLISLMYDINPFAKQVEKGDLSVAQPIL
jgi:hypothetical protein